MMQMYSGVFRCLKASLSFEFATNDAHCLVLVVCGGGSMVLVPFIQSLSFCLCVSMMM